MNQLGLSEILSFTILIVNSFPFLHYIPLPFHPKSHRNVEKNLKGIFKYREMEVIYYNYTIV